jgi:sulfite reductase (NADPH) flavoprotein alpha-component
VAAARENAPQQADAPTARVDVLFGSQTGNSEGIADELVEALGGRGIGGSTMALDDVTVEQLAAMEHVLVVTSTYGEGEMPDNAELFWEALASPTAPRLENLTFAVLALGDSAYQDFCQAGRMVDTRLEQLGATRLTARVDCDVDFEENAEAWSKEVVERLSALVKVDGPAGTGGAGADGPAVTVKPKKAKSKWNRKTPFASRLSTNRLLSAEGSAKEIRHFELDLGDSGIEYAAGDALAVVPRNAPALADAVLAAVGLDPEEAVDGVSLRELLVSTKEIRTPTADMLHALATLHPTGELATVLARDERDTLENWLWGRDLLDLLEATSEGAGTTPLFPAAEFLELLRPLQHRAYSISSSPLASPDRIHLTVAAVRHGGEREAGGPRGGVCSTFLADRLGETDEVGIFLQANAAFRVPEDDAAPAIMIGPGTGVAPFRAFLQERAGRGASGRNWLFFGDQHRATDFIYEQELLDWQESGLLSRLDLAFSRDQTEKVYVQTLMLSQAEDLFDWLEEGAHVYVCGDATRMAKDVDEALRTVIEKHVGNPDAAAEYMARLKREKRYVRDVY